MSDSTVANKVYLGRSKMEVKYPTSFPFSVSTKASIMTNLSDIENLGYFILKKNYLLDFYEELNESSLPIFNTITCAIESLGLDVQNITAFGADNASLSHTLVLKVFNEFSLNLKRVDELKECFQFVQQHFHNVLRHIFPVRWLCLKNVCDQILLKFIRAQKNELSEQLTLSECYIWFVHHKNKL
ncbi:Uncharacterized protein FWK35_00018851 [Aphis craccivora]|uniref:Uncharacterized protein n=1 Tax=Aphis craccivora TaxID=307492 RepID=A0A6G0X2I4_APHCR|nr:Uncharacterized protein FWK35_00018851 [Aphis craccivora]